MTGAVRPAAVTAGRYHALQSPLTFFRRPSESSAALLACFLASLEALLDSLCSLEPASLTLSLASSAPRLTCKRDGRRGEGTVRVNAL